MLPPAEAAGDSYIIEGKKDIEEQQARAVKFAGERFDIVK